MTPAAFDAEGRAALHMIYDGLHELALLEAQIAFVGVRALLVLFVTYDAAEVIVALGVESTNALLDYPTELVVDGRPSAVAQMADAPILRDIRRAHMAHVAAVGDEHWRTLLPPAATFRDHLAQLIREGRRRGECE